jgi:exonuclease SbcC
MPKISRLEIKNCLGISELEIQAGKVNIIKGGNEKGKTSILEVIEKGLQNTQRRTKFVRDGAKEATLYIEMDDATSIDRRIKPDGKTSSKITQHGASIPKPETYLKTIIGEGFGFNPIDFMGKKDKEQTEILLSLIPMRVTEQDLQDWFGEVPPVNLNQHAIDVLAYLAEKYFYDKRALANASVKD